MCKHDKGQVANKKRVMYKALRCCFLFIFQCLCWVIQIVTVHLKWTLATTFTLELTNNWWGQMIFWRGFREIVDNQQSCLSRGICCFTIIRKSSVYVGKNVVIISRQVCPNGHFSRVLFCLWLPLGEYADRALEDGQKAQNFNFHFF